MTAPVPAGSILVTADDRPLLAFCVARVVESRRLAGKPASPRLTALAATLSGTGQPDKPHDQIREPEYIGIPEAAQVLGCSERTARRLAPKLGGQQLGGRWMVDRLALAEHLQGKEHQ